MEGIGLDGWGDGPSISDMELGLGTFLDVRNQLLHK